MIQLVIDTVTVDGTDVTITAHTVADSSFVAASQQVTLIEPSASNASFARQFRITNNGVTCKRLGAEAVAISLDDFAKISVNVNDELSYAPYITAQPVDVTVEDTVEGEIEFTVASELPLTVAWESRAWDSETGYGEWTAIESGDAVSTDGDITTATLTFTAGSGVFLDETQIRATCTNSIGSVVTRNALLTVTEGA